MGVPTSEYGYTPAMPRREDHEVHKGHVVALGGGGGNFLITKSVTAADATVGNTPVQLVILQFSW